MSKRILLIQDDAATVDIVIKALTGAAEGAFQVEWVRQCSQALERLGGVEAILVDLNLPDSRGIETFRRLYEAAPRVPITILTDARDEAIAQLAVQRGAQDYVFKERLDAYLLPKTLRSTIERAAYTATLFEETERARITLDSIGDAVISTDASGQVNYLNAVAENLTGWTLADARGLPLESVFLIVDATTRQRSPNPMMKAIERQKAVSLTPDCVLLRRDGTEAAIEDSAAPIHDRQGAVTGAVMVFHDVSEARTLASKMSHLAQHDSLTDLPNRVLLDDRLSEAIALSSRYRRKLAILFLDLDRFKHVNDSLGHVVGDLLLQSVARRLFTCVRSSDTVGRRGGDEFVVLLWELRRPEDAALTATMILKALRKPHQVNERELHITGCIGISIYPDDGTEADALMKKADLAMYHAKESGRDNFQFFSPAMGTKAVERQSLLDGLQHAIERQELTLQYQPKLDLATHEIIGAEAIVRWQHPQCGLISPSQFNSLAEDCGLIVPLGRWVLREVCRQMREWQIAGLAPLCIAINLSVVELRAPQFVSGVRAILAETCLELRYLQVDLPESRLTDDTRRIEDSRSVAEAIQELKEVGALLALDDFGAGLSTTVQLRDHAIDPDQVGRSSSHEMRRSEDSIGVVIGLIGMGNSLHLRVATEDAGLLQQLESPQRASSTESPEYSLTKPVSAGEFGRLLQRSATAQHSYDQTVMGSSLS